MTAMSRREFMQRATVCSGMAGFLVANAADAAGFDGTPLGPLGLPIGSQVYPLRSMLTDFAGFARMMAEIGVRRLELCSPIGYGADFAALTNGREVKKILADQGMKSESSHFTMDELRNSQERSIEWAKEVGVKQMMTASLGDGNGGNNPTLDQVKRAADEYNKIAAVAAKAGLQQGLHNEGFELSIVEGKRTYDLLLDLLDPKLVKFQFQVSTISQGYEAAEYFTKYPGRFISMHVQGWSTGTNKMAPVGKDSLDWKKIFTAAKTGGIKNYFVEMDLELMRASVPYLQSLQV